MRCNRNDPEFDESDVLDLETKAKFKHDELDFLENELLKEKLGDFTLAEYTEKIIQYGYLMVSL